MHPRAGPVGGTESAVKNPLCGQVSLAEGLTAGFCGTMGGNIGELARGEKHVLQLGGYSQPNHAAVGVV